MLSHKTETVSTVRMSLTARGALARTITHDERMTEGVYEKVEELSLVEGAFVEHRGDSMLAFIGNGPSIHESLARDCGKQEAKQ